MATTHTPSRRLGRSGLTSSAVGLGTWPLGGAMALWVMGGKRRT